MPTLPRPIKYVLALCLLGSLGACGGNYESIYRTAGGETQGYRMAFIDAKQRGIILTKQEDSVLRFCAEPSPDALASVAASLSGSLSVQEKFAAALEGSIAGSAASIGLRTQSIQLMRDALYRLCEAHANGGISEFQMRSLHLRYQNMIVGLLAIEQLTGAMYAPPAGTSSSASTETTRDVPALTDRLVALQAREEALDATLAERTTTVTERQTALDAANKTVEELSGDAEAADQEAAKAEVTAAEEALAEAKEDLAKTEQRATDVQNALQAVRTSLALAANGSTTTSASAPAPTFGEPPEPLKADTAKVLSEEVRAIVKLVIQQDNSNEACIEFISSIIVSGETEASAIPAESALLAFCDLKLQAESEDIRAQLNKYGGGLANQIAAYLSEETRETALTAFPTDEKPDNLKMKEDEYKKFAKALRERTEGGPIHALLYDYLKTDEDPRGVANFKAALANIQDKLQKNTTTKEE